MTEPSVGPRRIQLKRTKGWRKPKGAVVVARPTRWGNPFRVGTGYATVSGPTETCGAVGEYGHQAAATYHYEMPLPGFSGLTAALAVELYRTDLLGTLADPDPYYDDIREALAGLRGKDLACWCALDQPCHADVLLEVANR